ncbi:hypothetical protein J7I93_23280, partial [Bacillus sp. ISL-47]|uniref:hypothetical protein n=1 Tax=Bacillus sp. ISL-47 TaxID=2819130 RepID=UPI001BE6A07F
HPLLLDLKKLSLTYVNMVKCKKKNRLGSAMVFLGLAAGLILLMSGIVGVSSSKAGNELAISGLLVVMGVTLIVFVVSYYRKRNKKKKGEGDDCCDFSFGYLDCPLSGHSSKRKDSGLFDCETTDCDCTPECGN